MLGMLMQRFEFVDHANYQLKIKESLTLKPDGLTITIRPRAGRTWGATPRPVAAAANPRTPALAVAPADRHGTPLLVLFGSNLGASEDIASRIARDATDRGYTARTAGLDDAVGELPTDGAVVVVTSSYNGQPPDNAAKFCRVGRRRRDLGDRRCATPSSAAATATGPRPTRPCRRGSTPRWRRAARPGCTRAGKATRAVTSTASSRPGTPGCSTRWARRSGSTRGRRRPPGAARGSPSSWSSAARRARSCSPTAARPRSCGPTASSPPARAPRVAVRCATSRSRCRPG